MTNQKLELTWLDKEVRINVEPRILIENASLSNVSFPSDNNILIHGDNLLGLKALMKDYCFWC